MATSSTSISRNRLDDYYNIPQGDECRQLIEQLNRKIFTTSSNIENVVKQMAHVEPRMSREISTLATCLQENLSKCTTSYAPHEEKLVQLDTAKKNLQKLTSLLDARKIFDSEALDLKTRPVDETMLPLLLTIGENLKVFDELGAKPKFDVDVYYEAKDRYLTWKGTEFAIKFGKQDALDDIFESFNTLESIQDFNRLYQRHFEHSLKSQLDAIIDSSTDKNFKQIAMSFVNQSSEFFRHHMTYLGKYCEEPFTLLLDAWNNYTSSDKFVASVWKSIETYTSFQILDDMKAVLTKFGVVDEPSIADVEAIIVRGLLEGAKKPLMDQMKLMFEAPPLNFRSISEITTSLENFSQLLNHVAHNLFNLYTDESYATSIIQEMFADYTKRLCRMEESSQQKVKLEEYLERINPAGKLIQITDDYRNISKVESGQELKNSRKWVNDRVKEAIRMSQRFVTDRMPLNGTDVYNEAMVKSALPTPSDFIVTATQNLLHLLRFWEDATASELSKMALANYFQQSPEEDEILSAVLNKISNHIVKKMLQSVSDVMSIDEKSGKLSRNVLKQINCDLEYLRDALVDLRAEDHKNLDEAIEMLQKRLQK